MRMFFTLALLTVLLTSFIAGPAAAGSQGGVTLVTPATPAAQASLNVLVEHSLTTQLQRCPAVEVHKRGEGWIAGTVGGAMVTVKGSGGCRVQKDPGTGRVTADVTVQWQTFNIETKARVASVTRTVSLPQDQCPAEFMTGHLKDAFGKQNARVCAEAFAPLREPISLPQLFTPALLPLGTVKDATDGDGNPALDLDKNGRTVRLSGTVHCQVIGDELEGDTGGNPLRTFQYVGALSLTDPATGERLGQWSEALFTLPGIGCTHALGVKPNARKLQQFHGRQEERIDRAIVGPGHDPATTTPSGAKR